MTPKKVYTTDDVGRICNVSLSTAINWVNTGKLPAYKTPGGHRRIKRDELLSFLKRYDMPISPELEVDFHKRILIVDDDPAIVNLLARALGKPDFGYTIAIATNGFDAGKQIVVFRPDLVILDIMLPGINGFGILKDIRNDKNTQNAKVLVITGYDSPEIRRKILESGADCYMAKPFELQKFVHKASVLLKEE